MKKTTFTLILGIFLTAFAYGQNHSPGLGSKIQKTGKGKKASTCDAALKKANYIKQQKIKPNPLPLSMMAPVNDDACNAIMIIVDDPAISGTNLAATAQPNEVTPPAASSCTSYDGWCENPPFVDNSVWYQFVVPATGAVKISTCDGAGSFDTQVALWQATDCNDFATYTFIGGNDDGANCVTQYTSLLLVAQLTPGDTLLVQVDGYAGDDGPFDISVTTLVGPANDHPCNATAVAVGGSAGVFTLVDAFTDANENSIVPPGVDCESNQGWCALEPPHIDNSVWFTFTAPGSGAVTVSTCNSANPFDTQLALYDVGNCNDFTTYSFIGGNDDGDTSLCTTSFDFFTSYLQVCGLTPGNTYYLLVDGYNAASGDFDLEIDSASAGAPPAFIAGANSAPDCPAGTNGTAAIEINSGIEPFTYEWSNGYIGSVLIGASGTYTVTVTDQCGMSTTGQVLIPANTSTLTVNTDSTLHICDTIAVTLSATSSGGVQNKSFLSFFGYDVANGDLIRFDSSNLMTPSVISAGNIESFYGGDLTPSGFYAIDDASSMLYQIELSSGAKSIIGPVSRNANHTWTGMAWDQTSSTLFGLSTDGVVTTLYAIDPLIPSATIITDLSSNVTAGIWLASSPGGTLFTLDAVGDSLYTVDKSTGITTLVGYIGFDANFAQGADFDDVTGILYMASYDNLGSGPGLYTVDTVTGASSLVGLLADEVDAFVCLPYDPAATDYSYSWSPATGLSATDIANPSASPAATTTYTITVADACGTTVTASQTVTVSNIVTAFSVTDVSVFGINDGEIQAIPSGGDAPYTFLWSTGGTTDTITNLFAGLYTVTVTDANGCSITDTTTVYQPPSSVEEIAGAGFSSLSISPNPSDGLITLDAKLKEKSAVEIKILSVDGKLIESIQIPAGTKLSRTFNLAKYGNGVYLIQLKTAKGIYNHRVLIQ